MKRIVMLVVLAACSSNTDEPLGSGHGTCSQRAGTFAATYSQRQGTCGVNPERISTIATQPTNADINAEGCTGSISYTPDNCEVTYNTTCPEDGIEKGGKLTISGTSKWNAGGTLGSAVEQWVIAKPDGTIGCRSTYDVAIRRQ